jgi:hypothetical protein
VPKTEAKKPNITSKIISKLGVTIVVETHFEVDNSTIEVDNQMVVIQVQVLWEEHG